MCRTALSIRPCLPATISSSECKSIMNTINDRLVEILKTEFPSIPAANIPTASMTSVEGWDSLATITLVTLIEESFGVQTEPEDIDELTSFDSISVYLERKVCV